LQYLDCQIRTLSLRSPVDQILLTLKTRGPQETLAMATRLGVSRQAALKTLERLAADGLVAHADERRGVGRPRRLWSLTAKAQGRFPDTHAQLTVEMLAAVRAEFGDEGVERLIARRERDAEIAYAQALQPATTLESRLARLTALRVAEGYMAKWSREADGSYLLVENHCPICAAAAACQGFCRAELTLFQTVLGPGVTVDRTDHILAGARRCAYRISAPAPRPASAA
jgi:predicted ArsR family transcriptional regulator